MKNSYLLPVLGFVSLLSANLAAAGTIPTLKYQDGGTSNSSGFVTGNVPIGAANGGIQDSGNQMLKTGVAARDPGATDDSTQGYSAGSVWINTNSGAMFVAGSVAPSAAVWTQATPTTYHPYQSIGWAFSNVATNTTVYLASGSLNGVNQNSEALFAGPPGSFSNFYVKTAAAPGAGNTYVATLYVGTPAAMSATAVTCTISDAATTCNDTVHSASIVEGQAWTIQFVTSSGATATSTSSLGIRVTY